MEAPKILKFKFDPNTATFINLKDKFTLILWGCIKTQHITDQYFNDNVSSFVRGLKKKFPDTYEQFITAVERSRLSSYGTKSIKNSWGQLNHTELDRDFWGGVWEYLSDKRELPVSIELS